MAYDPENIFAKIIREEAPAHRVYEDDWMVEFMDLMLQADGHTLVVPAAGQTVIMPSAFARRCATTTSLRANPLRRLRRS